MSWTWHQAQDAMQDAADEQEASEQHMRDTAKEAAVAKRDYQRALAVRIVELKARGNAVTACETIAKGEDDISDLRFQRDLKEAEAQAARAANYRQSANRQDTLQLARWAQAREMADGNLSSDARVAWSDAA